MTGQNTRHNTGGGNVHGRLLGHEVKTKPAQPTSAQPLGASVDDLLRPLQAGKQGRGFVSPALYVGWAEIVGPRLAKLCFPVRIRTQPKSRSRHKKPGDDGAILEVLADPSILVDLEYGQALIVDKINTALGYHAVARLKVKPRQAARNGIDSAEQQRPLVVSRATRNQVGHLTEPVDDEALRALLQNLGEQVLAAHDQRSRS